MKNHVALYGSAAAVIACGLIIARNTEEVPAAISAKSGVSQAEHSVAAHAVTSAEALAQAGTLWEPQAGNSREAQRTAIQVAAAPLRGALAAAPGTRLELALSPRFAPLEATVTASNTHEDGTITTFLRVEGSPAGTLTLQENVEAGFFLGQLYYDGDHPVAYEFRPQGDAMEVSRHAVSDLLCAELDSHSTKVDSAGLPSAEAIEGIENAKKSKKKKGLSNANGSSSISINDATLTEGDSGTTNLTFTVRLSQMNRRATTTVNFTTVDGSAIAGTDYTAKSGTVTFKPKDISETITIPVIGDLTTESNKTFTVQLSNPVNSTLGDSAAVGTILDNDSAPTLSVSGASVNEGNSGQTTASVAVTLSKAFTSPVTVNYSTVNSSATAGSDYTAATGTLTFNPGETSKSVAASIAGDTNVESNETFVVSLSSASGASIAASQATVTIVNDDSTTSSSSSNVPQLDSLPGATAVIYLDMDGQVVSGTQWAGGGTINALGVDGTMSSTQMTEIWKRVSEDYAPFNVNVTTSEAAYLAAPTNRRIRCIITPTNSWYGNYGGVAYVNSFSWTGDTPCWVFAAPLGYSTRFISDAATHEIGHTMGLNHDGRTSPSEGYYQGHGSGEVSWAPIMGVGYYSNLVQWSKGEYAYASQTQDDLAIITGSTNGFGYRADAVGNTPATATVLTDSGSTLAGSGFIETRTDLDVFSFTTAGGSVSLTVSGSADGQNIDLSIAILDASGQVIASANPDTMTDATVNATLNAGTYYLRVDGTGRGSATSDGYTDYGSLGQYTIQGTAP
jgi:hypothetical protein